MEINKEIKSIKICLILSSNIQNVMSGKFRREITVLPIGRNKSNKNMDLIE